MTSWPHLQLAWHLSSELGCVLLGRPLVLGETTTRRWETSALLGADQCFRGLTSACLSLQATGRRCSHGHEHPWVGTDPRVGVKPQDGGPQQGPCRIQTPC